MLIDYGDFDAYGRPCPSEVQLPGHNASSIGAFAFIRRGLTGVSIPEGIVSIGREAFRENSLKEVRLPRSLHFIGYYAFHKNDLVSVVIPENVAQIGHHAFRENPRLSYVCIEAAQDEITIDFSAFATGVTVEYASVCGES